MLKSLAALSLAVALFLPTAASAKRLSGAQAPSVIKKALVARVDQGPWRTKLDRNPGNTLRGFTGSNVKKIEPIGISVGHHVRGTINLKTHKVRVLSDSLVK